LKGTVHALRDDALANASSLVEVGGGVASPSTRRETSTLILASWTGSASKSFATFGQR
jgi:hypothetical protein